MSKEQYRNYTNYDRIRLSAPGTTTADSTILADRPPEQVDLSPVPAFISGFCSTTVAKPEVNIHVTSDAKTNVPTIFDCPKVDTKDDGLYRCVSTSRTTAYRHLPTTRHPVSRRWSGRVRVHKLASKRPIVLALPMQAKIQWLRSGSAPGVHVHRWHIAATDFFRCL